MSLETVWSATVELVRANIAWAEPLVFLMGLAEGIPGLSLLVPSSALFLAIGTAHGATGGAFWHLWLAATAGAVIGDCITYSLGRLLRHDVERLGWFAVHPNALAAGHAVFERWGALAVLVGKFTGFARPFIPVVAGIVVMPLPMFIGASVLSSLAWAGAFLAPGYGLKLLID
ncbi:MAG: DedA family protein [Hyphomicrobiaceae bacterium]